MKNKLLLKKNIFIKMSLVISLSLVMFVNNSIALNWNEVIDTKEKHDRYIHITNHLHFTREWMTTGTWNGSEGYYRWTAITQPIEDSDGYLINHPNTTSNSIYISWMMRVGPDLDDAQTGAEWKFVMFYPVSGGPRPTILTHKANDSRTYYVFMPAADANGEGLLDEFRNSNPMVNYPNHRFKIGPAGHNQWYFVVAGIVGNQTKMWIWSQDGALNGYYAESREKIGGYNTTWDFVRLLAYIKPTVERGPGGYIDICHISVHNALPSPPAGFRTGPSTVQDLRILPQ